MTERRRRRNAAREAGFTLIELMIVVAILGILGDTMARVLRLELRGVLEAEMTLGRVEQVRRASSALVRDVKAARTVDAVPAWLGGKGLLRITELDGRKVEYGLVRGVLTRRATGPGKRQEFRALAREVREIRMARITGKGGRVTWVGWNLTFVREPGRVHAAAAALPR
ncbi:MAG: prepilin-type N-terminal cleavage/methylation domain-containing protein [Candidatus Coatesbacteria bacterium]